MLSIGAGYEAIYFRADLKQFTYIPVQVASRV
jgi:hypothetical protein